jgi:hypothetical protein
VFWQDADAWLDELAPGPPPIVLGGHVAFTAGPQLGDVYLARLDGTAEYRTDGRFTGTLLVQLGGGDDPYELPVLLRPVHATFSSPRRRMGPVCGRQGQRS